MKPPIQYFGAKGNIAEKIVALMPEHRGYIEPFAGSLAVLLAKPASKIEVVNDLDQRLMTFWRVLRDRGEDLARVAELTPHSRAELLAARETDAEDELEIARRVWVLLTQGRTRTLKGSTGWRFYSDPRGTSASFTTYMEAYRDRLLPAAERIRSVSLECRPALEVIAQYGAFEDNLLYVDPPYVHSSRRGARYSHEMTDADHMELTKALSNCKAAVMVSGYQSRLYDRAFGGWHHVDLTAQSGNSLERSAHEVIWSNREVGNFLDLGAIA